MKVNNQILQQVIGKIAVWFQQNGRKELPWRKNPTPYRVWISEIMLQQTRIEAVIPHYHAFMEQLPDVYALAAVEEERLLKLWEGLGYYSRARNLQKAAKKIVEQYGGELPHTVKELQKLDGIGAYTAGAIASVAYGEPEPAVDGNVLRVLARLFLIDENVLDPRVRTEVSESLRAVYPAGQEAAYVTEGLMELGEVLCLPNGVPHCDECPVREFCGTYKQGVWQQYPVRVKEQKRTIEQKTVLLLRCGDLFAMRRRAPQGLLASMWEFPNLEGQLSADEVLAALRKQGVSAQNCTPCGEATHLFTHREWRMTGYIVMCEQTSEGYLWKTPQQIFVECAVPSAFAAYTAKLRNLVINNK
jgi:A/G-specific adenine glycosylase